MKFTNCCLLSGLIFALLACKTLSSRSRLDTSDEANLDYFDRRLGSGFDSDNFRKLSPCLETSSFVYAGSNTSDYTFYRDYDYNELIDVASGGLYGKASFLGLVSAKIQGDMATSLASTDESASFVYQFNIRGKSAVLDELKFNARGASAFNSGDMMKFREDCGNQYVERLSLGSQLFVGVKYVFNSKETKQEFKLKLSIELFWGLIKKSKTWTKEQREMLKNVLVTVEAYQIGGDPRKLEELKSRINKLSCFGEDTEACSDAVERLLAYGRDDLPSQLNNMEMTEEANKGLAILSVGTKNYSDDPILNPMNRLYTNVPQGKASSASEELADLLSKLERIKVDLKMAQSRVKALLSFNVSQDERNNLRLVSQDVDGTLSSLQSVVNGNCKKAMSDLSYLARCSAETAAIEKQAEKSKAALQIPDRT